MSSQIFEWLGVDPAIIMAILIVLVLILLLSTFILLGKVNRLTKRYELFMRGKNCETMEDNIIEIYKKLQLMQNKDLANKDILKMLNREMVNAIQKTGLVKYNAFEGMGGQSSFALTMLNMEDTGYILNAMHSRNSCYMYIKEVKEGEPEVPLSREEKLSLDRALDKKERALGNRTADKEKKGRRKRSEKTKE